jgi:nicotinamide riboside transporter PnuC
MRLILGLLSVLPFPVQHMGSGDSVQPRDTVSVIDSIAPALPSGVQVDIVGSDTFVRVQSDGHDVMVTGYKNEPYMHITTKGEVFVNDGSQTTLINGDRYGNVDTSSFVESPSPVWRKIGMNGIAMWHDHRVHWMSPKQPAPIDTAGTVLEWKVSMSVDGVATTVAGTLFLREKASMLWWLAGFAALLCAVVLSVRRRREFFVLTFLVSMVGVAIGLMQYLGLPDGARITPMILMFSTGAAVVAAVSMFMQRRGHASQHIAVSLNAGAGATLVVCGWLCADQVRAAYVPGIDQEWLVRMLIPALLGIGFVATIDGVTRIMRGSTD